MRSMSGCEYKWLLTLWTPMRGPALAAAHLLQVTSEKESTVACKWERIEQMATSRWLGIIMVGRFFCATTLDLMMRRNENGSGCEYVQRLTQMAHLSWVAWSYTWVAAEAYLGKGVFGKFGLYERLPLVGDVVGSSSCCWDLRRMNWSCQHYRWLRVLVLIKQYVSIAPPLELLLENPPLRKSKAWITVFNVAVHVPLFKSCGRWRSIDQSRSKFSLLVF